MALVAGRRVEMRLPTTRDGRFCSPHGGRPFSMARAGCTALLLSSGVWHRTKRTTVPGYRAGAYSGEVDRFADKNTRQLKNLERSPIPQERNAL
jgi:hypothetical protein